MNKHKRIAIYPGTFDPVTHGHLDILSRASMLFDEIIVGLAQQSSKKTLFSLPERLQLLKKSLKDKTFHCPIHVHVFDGLVVNFAIQSKAGTLIRGLRAISDFEYEFQMALMNRHQDNGIETVFFMPDEKYVYLSSSLIKEVARLKGRLTHFVPGHVIKALARKFPPQI